MNIIVCIKQVPDTTEVKIDPVTNTLIRQGVPSIVNPFDKNALETALQLKEKHGGKVTVLSMGPAQAKEALKECLAMGADEAVLISDRAFGGADTLATSYTLAAAARKLGHFDLILCGKQAIDGDTAQVGPEMAEHLGIAQLTYVCKIEVEGTTVRGTREHEECFEVVEGKFPLVVTVVKTINEPRYSSCKGVLRALRTNIQTLTAQDLIVDAAKLGLKGSPTQVRKIFSPSKRTDGVKIQMATAKESVSELMQKLADAKIV
ncbi:MAG: Electron transfer flavoprotein alpha/beta-subunit [Holophagaceae bacterium]|nr:Electron transfer flavoprotein alpha/beta-subunit [Holophagaceae bacterium]